MRSYETFVSLVLVAALMRSSDGALSTNDTIIASNHSKVSHMNINMITAMIPAPSEVPTSSSPLELESTTIETTTDADTTSDKMSESPESANLNLNDSHTTEEAITNEQTTTEQPSSDIELSGEETTVSISEITTTEPETTTVLLHTTTSSSEEVTESSTEVVTDSSVESTNKATESVASSVTEAHTMFPTTIEPSEASNEVSTTEESTDTQGTTEVDVLETTTITYVELTTKEKDALLEGKTNGLEITTIRTTLRTTEEAETLVKTSTTERTTTPLVPSQTSTSSSKQTGNQEKPCSIVSGDLKCVRQFTCLGNGTIDCEKGASKNSVERRSVNSGGKCEISDNLHCPEPPLRSWCSGKGECLEPNEDESDMEYWFAAIVGGCSILGLLAFISLLFFIYKAWRNFRVQPDTPAPVTAYKT